MRNKIHQSANTVWVTETLRRRREIFAKVDFDNFSEATNKQQQANKKQKQKAHAKKLTFLFPSEGLFHY